MSSVKVFSAAAESCELSQGAELHLLQSFTSSSKNVSLCLPVLRLTIFFRILICEITDIMYSQTFEIKHFGGGRQRALVLNVPFLVALCSLTLEMECLRMCWKMLINAFKILVLRKYGLKS